MASNFKRIMHRFSGDTSGNIVIMGSVGLLALLFAVGAAVDIARLTQSATKLQDLNDAAALAVSKRYSQTLDSRREDFAYLMTQGINASSELSGFEFDLKEKKSQTELVVTVSSRAESELFFPELWGEKKSVSALSEVIISSQTMEIAMVLDISSSMNDARLTELKAASKSLINTLLDDEDIRERVSISMTPFGGTVRLPHALEHMLIPPPTTAHWEDGTWNGCFSMSPIDYTNGILPGDKFEFMPDFYAFTTQNPWCPEAGNELQPLTNDRDKLFAVIDNFQRSDGTGTDIAAVWGFSTLDPNWRGAVPGGIQGTPRNFDTRTRKIMIIMSDGGLTAQITPTPGQLLQPKPIKGTQTVVARPAAQQGYEDICAHAKSKGVTILTVGFSIDNPGHENDLKSCASEGGHISANVGQLEAAFSQVALSVSPTRLSR